MGRNAFKSKENQNILAQSKSRKGRKHETVKEIHDEINGQKRLEDRGRSSLMPKKRSRRKRRDRKISAHRKRVLFENY